MEEARFGAQPQLYYGMPSTDLRAVAKRGLEWDPNDWRWDGDLFIATPLNPTSSNFQSRQLFPLQTQLTTTLASSNSSSSFSDELDQPTVKDNRELEKKRRIQDSNLAADNLTLNLGGRGYAVSPNTEPTTGKKTKLAAPTPNRAVCQVDDCGADLSKAKDYHRRHKVCEMHSKASKALVANQMQRFCQQCSRSLMKEREAAVGAWLATIKGGGKHRQRISNNSPINDNQASGYLLMSILKILSNMHSNKSNHTDDQDLLSHLLQTLAKSVPALLSNDSLGQRSMQEHCTTTGDEMPRKVGDLQASSQRPGIVLHTQATSQIYDQGRETSGGRSKLNNFDLNDIYVDSDDGMDDIERSTVPQGLGIGCSSWAQQESHQSSPPQTSGNSDSASAQSPSSSSGEAQSHTDRIVFKLFGKEPSDFPIVLRAQIFDWLSHSPTDIESYIRPGCVILTIYLRLSESSWEEVEDHSLSSSFFPFIVAEDDVCTEICMLEKEIELTEIDNLQRGGFYVQNQAMEFIHEMGWLLHKFQSKLRFGHEDSNLGLFPFERFKYLVEFSVDHDWCSVVNKLLDILFYGIVSGGEQPFVKFALSEMGLLHRAVRRNSRTWRSDPSHVAAGRDGSEDILDALTDDPGKVGIGAWKSALDSTGFTPEDYARLRGHYSYIHLVQRKINRRVSSGHVVVDISDTVSESSINQKPNMEPPASFEIGIKGIQRPCGVCAQNMAHRTGSRTLLYRPAMLSMLAIAAVCVCVAILMKSLPRVLFVFRPFSWEMLEYGSS
ncbi:Squamosa promoter-binding-like protein 1 [Sesamum angolense]|uniref:Squamosa promoter-binding-like protein 1 n=1 Tax=Sesamum angolense TaxID=2727404 RepID=A0AAE1X7R2_9LAMI|nr:Squamosa promoter-binding-like protein 1 [Sesamum angolense]